MTESDLNPLLRTWLPTDTPETATVNCRACALPAKCCDFQPFVANFLLGRELAPEPSWQVSLQPIGVVATAAFRRAHAARSSAAPAAPVARTAPAVRCALLSPSGACTIWNRRPGECSTYLCTPTHPRRQQRSERAFAVEVAVAQMALAHLGFSPRELRRQIDFLNNPEQVLPEPPREDLLSIYAFARDWATRLTAEEIAGWLREKDNT